MNKFLLIALAPCLMLPLGCGDDGTSGGSGGGFGAVGGTLGGEATTEIVYVTNTGSNDVSGYSIATTGALTPVPGTPFKGVSKPSAVVVSSNGFFAYVANSDTNKVTSFRISGEGSLIAGSSSTTGTTPVALAISPDTKFLYVANSGSDDVNVFSIGAGGVLTAVGATNSVSAVGKDPASMGIARKGKFLYTANRGTNDVTAFSIGTTGLLTLISPSVGKANPISTGGKAPSGMVASEDGSTLYVANSDPANVTRFKIEDNGLLTLASTTPISAGGKNPTSLALSGDGKFLYAANGQATVSVFTIGDGGLLTPTPNAGGTSTPIPAGTIPIAMTISADGRFLYITNRDTTNGRGRVLAYRVNDETGALLPVNPLQQGVGFPVGDEPSSIAAPGRLSLSR